MNVLINFAPGEVTERKLEENIAHVLHNELRSYSVSGLPTNFKLQLFTYPRSRKPNGRGLISIPYEEIAYQLMERQGGLLRIPGVRSIIRLKRASEQIPGSVLDELRNHAYEPPHIKRARLGHVANLADPVPIAKIDIGFFCRDGVLSIEWTSITPHGEACFDAFFNNLRLFLWHKGHHAVIQPFSTEVFVADEKGLNVFMFLSEAASFEDSGGPRPSDNAPRRAHNENGDDPLRVRLHGLDAAHAEIVPWINKCFRITFEDKNNFDRFLMACKEVGFVAPALRTVKCRSARKLYAKDKVQKVRDCAKRLEWPVYFQIEMLLSNGILTPEEILRLNQPLWDARLLHDDEGIINALKTLASIEERQRYQLYRENREEDIVKLMESILADRLTAAVQTFWTKRKKVEPNRVLLHQITFTPTARFLEGPTWEQSNRVLRRFEDHLDHFIRVTFAEEDHLIYRSNRDVDSRTFLHERFGSIIKRGFDLGGQHFDILAYSNSALKEHTVYFVRPFKHAPYGQLDAHSIRNSLGDFTKVIRQPARFGARLSQAFSSTDKSITLEEDQILRRPDIKCDENLFTDGCGSMSSSVARAIGRALHTKSTRPNSELDNLASCQMRIGGAKGVMSVDTRLEGHCIVLRPSQEKFLAYSRDVEICSLFTRPLPYFLNRPLIKILEDLKVDPNVFLAMQKREIENARAAQKSIPVAAKVFQMHGYGESYRLPALLRRIEDFLHLSAGGQHAKLGDDFIEATIALGVKDVLKQLKHKARIPVALGYTLVGIADEYNIIPEGSIYARIEKKGQPTRCITGQMAVSRSPNLHPGDIQICYGLEDRHLRLEEQGLAYPPNVLVFSVDGERSLPSMLAGGDLDGDLYNILFDPDLMPKEIIEPADYPPTSILTLNRDCHVDDIADFVIDYMINDCTGLVSTLHLQIADEEEEGTKSDACVALAHLHSKSVDFQKSGLPVYPEEFPRPMENRKPDFLSPEGTTKRALDAKYYPSNRVLGQLFRAVDLHENSTYGRRGNHSRISRFEKHGAVFEHDTAAKTAAPQVQVAIQEHLNLYNITCKPTEADRNAMSDLYEAYTNELTSICANNCISRRFDRAISEEEAFIGLITYSDAAIKRKRTAVANLREQTLNVTECVLAAIAEQQDRWVERALAAWELSSSKGTEFGARSFSWLVLGSLIEAMKLKASMPDSLDD